MPAVETKKRPESGVRILIKITFKKRWCYDTQAEGVSILEIFFPSQ